MQKSKKRSWDFTTHSPASGSRLRTTKLPLGVPDQEWDLTCGEECDIFDTVPFPNFY